MSYVPQKRQGKRGTLKDTKREEIETKNCAAEKLFARLKSRKIAGVAGSNVMLDWWRHKIGKNPQKQ